MGPARVGVNPITLSADRETLFSAAASAAPHANFLNKPRKL